MAPVWQATAIVAAFPTLDYVPDGYSTVAITTQELPLDRGGFHYPDSGAGALVHYDDRWTINASHEVMEMVVDPLGVRYVFGPSLADQNPDGADDDETRAEAGEQGLVEYIVEICDPVEGQSYVIDGVSVCDFVFPAFYDCSSYKDRYSFTCAVDGPFQLADGGYMSWAVERPRGGVFQAVRSGEKLTWRKVADTSSNFSRPLVDSFEGELKRNLSPSGTRARASGPSARRAGQTRGDRLRGVIGQQLAPRDPENDPYVSLIDRLANDDDFYEACNEHPQKLLAELRKIAQAQGTDLDPDLFDKQKRIAPQPDYQAVSAMYHGAHPLGYDFRQPQDALQLAGMFSL